MNITNYLNNVDRNNFIGIVCESINSGSFVIENYHNKSCVNIKFLSTGYENTVSMGEIRCGHVKDPFTPSVHGVGIFGDRYKAYYKDSVGKSLPKSEYTTWNNMLSRCYNPKSLEKRKTYEGCIVSENFKYYPYFYDWCNRQIGFGSAGFHLDKDLLLKGNKVYSEDTCVFIPKEVNAAFTKSNATRGCFPVGVYWNKRQKSFVAQVHLDSGQQIHLGYFKTVEDAFCAYKSAKEAYIKELAQKYITRIDVRAYNALMNYKVEITD